MGSHWLGPAPSSLLRPDHHHHLLDDYDHLLHYDPTIRSTTTRPPSPLRPDHQIHYDPTNIIVVLETTDVLFVESNVLFVGTNIIVVLEMYPSRPTCAACPETAPAAPWRRPHASAMGSHGLGRRTAATKRPTRIRHTLSARDTAARDEQPGRRLVDRALLVPVPPRQPGNPFRLPASTSWVQVRPKSAETGEPEGTPGEMPGPTANPGTDDAPQGHLRIYAQLP